MLPVSPGDYLLQDKLADLSVYLLNYRTMEVGLSIRNAQTRGSDPMARCPASELDRLVCTISSAGEREGPRDHNRTWEVGR